MIWGPCRSRKWDMWQWWGQSFGWRLPGIAISFQQRKKPKNCKCARLLLDAVAAFAMGTHAMCNMNSWTRFRKWSIWTNHEYLGLTLAFDLLHFCTQRRWLNTEPENEELHQKWLGIVYCWINLTSAIKIAITACNQLGLDLKQARWSKTPICWNQMGLCLHFKVKYECESRRIPPRFEVHLLLMSFVGDRSQQMAIEFLKFERFFQ